jgi:hypothetical protein
MRDLFDQVPRHAMLRLPVSSRRPGFLAVSVSVAAAVFAVALALPAAPALAQAAPKPDTYLCPNVSSGASVDCFLDAVGHLYTMCRQVKSIEIIEFGYEDAEKGVNAAKTEYCIDKHKLSMTRPYQAALREATGNRPAVDQLRAMYDRWLDALQELRWKPGETDDQYKQRVAQPYQYFKERAEIVRTALASGPKPASAEPAAAKAKPVAKGKAADAPATARATN